MSLLHFYPPLQAQNYLYDFFSLPNEILHKLTSCHFTLRNKTLNDLCLKILPFLSLLRTKLYNSSENNNSNTRPFLSSLFVTKVQFLLQNFRFTVIFITLLAKHFFPKIFELHFQIFISEKYN